MLRKVNPPQEETPNYMRLLDSVDCCLVKEMIASLENNEPYNGGSLREDFLLRLVEFDFEYNRITDRLERDNFPIESFSFDEIPAFITYMARAEHWCEGSFEEFLKDGTVLRVLKRLKELTYEDDEED